MANIISATEILEKYNKGELDVTSFLHEFGKATVYFSTPFGDHKDGGQRMFVISGPDNTAYLPVFSTDKKAIDFFEKAGRAGYLLMNMTFHEVLTTAKKANENAPLKLGAIIDFGESGITVDVANLDAVISMTA